MIGDYRPGLFYFNISILKSLQMEDVIAKAWLAMSFSYPLARLVKKRLASVAQTMMMMMSRNLICSLFEENIFCLLKRVSLVDIKWLEPRR